MTTTHKGRYFEAALSNAGVLIASGTAVAVVQTGTTTLVSLYGSRTGGAVSNPTTVANASVGFYADWDQGVDFIIGGSVSGGTVSGGTVIATDVRAVPDYADYGQQGLPGPAGATGATGATGAAGSAGQTTGLYSPSTWGRFWSSAIRGAASGTQLATIAIQGDSVSRGMMASDPDATGWVALMRAALQADYGDGGSGFHGVCDWSGNIATLYNNATTFPNTVISSTGSWANLAPASLTAWRAGTGGAGYNDGPGGNAIVNWAGLGGSAVAGTLTGKVRGRYVTVFYAQGSGFSGTSVSVDSGTAVSVPTSSTSGVATYTVDMGAGNTGWHTVAVTATAGGYTGIWGFRGVNDSGVVVDNYSRPGAASGWWANTSSTYGLAADWSGGSKLPCDLLIQASGLNDALLNISPATFTQNLDFAQYDVRQALASTSVKHGAIDSFVLLNHGGTADLGVGFNYPQYGRYARTAAEMWGGVFVNLWTDSRNSWDYWNQLGYWGDQVNTPVGKQGTDAVHPGTVGQAFMWQRISTLIPGLFPQ